MTGALVAAACVVAAFLVTSRSGRLSLGATHPRSSPEPRTRRRTGRRARRAQTAAVAESLMVLDSVGPALRAGLAPSTALAHLAATLRRPGGLADDLAAAAGRPAAHVQAPGEASPVGRVWTHWARRTGADELELVAAAWTLADVTGVALADAVDLAARLLRDTRARRARLDVVLAGPRATMTLLTALPVAGPVVGLMFGIAPLTLYAGSPVSALAAGCGVVLVVVGRLWCRRLLRGSLSAGDSPARFHDVSSGPGASTPGPSR